MFVQAGAVSTPLFIINYLFAVIDGVLASQRIIWLQKIFDLVSEGTKTQSSSKLIQVILIWMVICICNEVVNGLYNACGEEHSLRTQMQLGHKIHQKAARLEPVFFENESALNKITQSFRGAMIGRNYVNTFVTALFLYVPYYGSLLWYLYGKQPEFVWIVVIILVLSILSQIKKSRFYLSFEEDTMGNRRRVQYYSNCICDCDYAKETKFLGVTSFFREKIQKELAELLRLKRQAGLKSALVDAGIYTVTWLGYAGIIGLLLYSFVQGKTTIGVVAGLFCSIDSMFQMTDGAVEECISYGMELRGKVEMYLEFLKLPEKEKKQDFLKTHGDIDVNHVSFTYPGAKNPAIRDLSLHIKEGEHIAIVGENGSGKTTLVRLLVGILLADQGEIRHNNQNLKECSRYQLFHNISGVFQRFGKYKLSLEENIRISSPDKTFQRLEIAKQLDQLGLNVDHLPQGFDTLLGKEYGGIDLSGGQWNRIAIARGLYKESTLIVLDEPTAAIDPIEEKKLYEMFESVSKGKTSIMITHRLSSVRLASRILVMDQGRLIGVGTHEELIEKCRKYREMWELQKNQYLCSE